MEVHDTVQEAEIKIIPKEKKCKKQNDCLRRPYKYLGKRERERERERDAKGKREKERYIYLNAELQSITRRDKKAFFSDQCKEIEENNRMGKTTVLFKKIRDTKGIFQLKMGSI